MLRKEFEFIFTGKNYMEKISLREGFEPSFTRKLIFNREKTSRLSCCFIIIF